MPERIPLSYPLIIPAYSAVRYMATTRCWRRSQPKCLKSLQAR